MSVVVPAYNAAWCIERTIASVRAQTYADFEVVVVDDGSTDETAAVVQAAIADDPRFRLVRQPNGGVSRARNRGLGEARGVYFAPLDADDLWEPSFLERMVQALERAGPGVVFAFARSLWVDHEDRLLEQAPAAFPSRVDYRELLLRNPVGNSSCAIFRTAEVRAVGGYDEDLVRYGCSEDWLLMLRLSWRGGIAPVDEFLVRYRQSSNSASRTLQVAFNGLIEAIQRARREGPQLPRSTYWLARSLSTLWLMRRALHGGQFATAARLAAVVYLQNPLWWMHRDLRSPIVNQLRRPQRLFGLASGSSLERA